ncbi:MAG: hypothetical protein M3358_06560, partial [Actinomycetota bacterium]|nr:hypothetical protein [Actinomycetota bacterium]
KELAKEIAGQQPDDDPRGPAFEEPGSLTLPIRSKVLMQPLLCIGYHEANALTGKTTADLRASGCVVE